MCTTGIILPMMGWFQFGLSYAELPYLGLVLKSNHFGQSILVIGLILWVRFSSFWKIIFLEKNLSSKKESLELIVLAKP